MFSKVNAPFSLLSDELDEYLEKGWFRMGQALFTTNFLNFKTQFYSAVWLRTDLKSFAPDSTFLKLKKLNAGFQFRIQRFNLTSDKHDLFNLYRGSVPFDASDSLVQLLYGTSGIVESIFDTYEVCLYDDEKLIATGVFDMGMNAAAGISSFYHPEYKKHSLGKYLIYLKIEFCKNAGLDYFYPGYFVPGYQSFDYKLSIARDHQYFFSFKKNQWLSAAEFSAEYDLLNILLNKLNKLKAVLDAQNIPVSLMQYEFFQANMVIELTKYDLFDYPVFLYLNKNDQNFINPIIVFDILDGTYKLVECKSVWQTFENEDKDNVFADHLLKIDRVVFASTDPCKMAENLF